MGGCKFVGSYVQEIMCNDCHEGMKIYLSYF